MPSREVVEEMVFGEGGTIGRQLKAMSDFVVDETWNNDVGDQTGYLYNYDTDNEPLLRTGFTKQTDEDSLKHPVRIRSIIKSYRSIAKDDPELHVLFKPSDWNRESVVPRWWKDKSVSGVDYIGLDIPFPVGCYIDIADDKGIYEKWLVVYDESANQLPKFGILKCNHLFQWVSEVNGKRFIREVWGVVRSQNSYNSGVYTYDKFTVEESQSKAFLPYNSITAELFYNKRIFLSLPLEKPLTWDITKVETMNPKGVLAITLYQSEYNSETDGIWMPEDPSNPLPGQYTMLADYYKKPTAPVVEPTKPTPQPDPEPSSDSLVISCGSPRIYINRSKTLTANCVDVDGIDVTSKYTSFTWSYTIDGLDASSVIDQSSVSGSNKVKIIFTGDESYAFNTVVATCVATDGVSEVTSSISIDILA